MGDILNFFKERSKDDWLVGRDCRQLYQLTENLLRELSLLSVRKRPLKIIISERDPIKFFSAFLAALSSDTCLFLGNPCWTEREWKQVFNSVQPHLILGNFPANCFHRSPIDREKTDSDSNLPAPSIGVPTGGSSGQIRFAIHTWQTLAASAQGFYQFFGEQPIHSFCVLPLYHVSGLMQFIRSFITGGKIIFYPYKLLKLGVLPEVESRYFFISLVPTQLQVLLENNSDWLSTFRTILLGGAPAWSSLLNQARKYQLRLSPTYGMTETASQIATLKPDEFLSNNRSVGKVLPHAKVKICSETGEKLADNRAGIITIQSDSLFWGYYSGDIANPAAFQTDDIGFFDSEDNLHVIGRNSQKIITGGENVFPLEVEGEILATELVKDVGIVGLPDSQWGQAIAAVYIPKDNRLSIQAIKTALEDKISPYKQPKYWVEVERLPRNQQGKLNYQQLKKIAELGVRSHDS